MTSRRPQRNGLHTKPSARLGAFALSLLLCACSMIHAANSPESLRVRFVGNPQVTRPVIRLSQVIENLDGPLPVAWQSQVVAVMPPDAMQIELSKGHVIAAFKILAPELHLQWYGDETIRVMRTATLKESIAEVTASAPPPLAARPIETITPSAQILTVRSPVQSVHREVKTASLQAPANKPTSTQTEEQVTSPIEQTSAATRVEVPQRIRRLIQQAVERALRDSEAGFTAELDWSRAPAPFARATRIASVSLPAPLTAGDGLLQVMVDSPDGNGSFGLPAAFTEVPTFLVASRPLRAGQIINESDVARRTSTDTKGLALINDPELVLGKQARRYLAAGAWITHDSVGNPIVIRKQDLVEVRVEGGGVVIRTTARSLDEGSVGDLITVETIDPKRKILARVVSTGIVEVLTRPPQVP